MPFPVARRSAVPWLALLLSFGFEMASVSQEATASAPVSLPQAAGPSPVSVVAAPTLKWAYGGCFSSWCQTGWYSSPAVADLNGDGTPEVLWGSYDLTAVSGVDGRLIWRASSGNRIWPGVAVADLTGDGSTEIIVGRGAGRLSVYNATGGVVWTATAFGDGGEIRSLAVEEIDRDGQFEIIVGKAGSGATKHINVFRANGTVKGGWPARRDGEPGYGWGMYNQNVAVADLAGDGRKEIIGPTDTHYITALDSDGNQLPANAIYGAGKVWSQVGVHVQHSVDLRGYANCGSEHRPNFANSPPTIADLNGDGTNEIVVVGNVYNCGTNPYSSLYAMPFVFRADRTRWSGSGFDWTSIPDPGPASAPLSEDYNVIESAEPNPVAADLDGDGIKEILFASYDGKLHAYWLDKTEHGSWPYQVPGDGIRFASEPAIADLDNDGRAEVLFTSWPQKVAGRLGQLHILDSNGTPLHVVNLPAPRSGSVNGALAAPTLADIDGDGELEVVVNTIASGAVAYDLPGSRQARILWGTGRGNLQRTGTPPVRETQETFVPIILSSGGLNGSFFTSELTLTNRGTQRATLQFAYNAAIGSGSGTTTDALEAGQQRIVSDAIGYLRTLGVPIPSFGSQGGTLRVGFSGLSSPGDGHVTVRTTTVVAAGRAGLAYSGISVLTAMNGPSYLCGLRQNQTDRSNIALQNAGSASDGPITLRVTVFSGEGGLAVSQPLPDQVLVPGAFVQISGVLASNGLSLSNGYARVERVSGTAPYYAYGVINDQANSDGSFIPPIAETAFAGKTRLTLPVVVEAGAFSTELILTNWSSTTKALQFSYVADAIQTANQTATFTANIPPFSQSIWPEIVQRLRDAQTAGIGPKGTSFAGALIATVSSGDLSGISVSARTAAQGDAGWYGLFYTAQPAGANSTSEAWLYGLQQNAENRTNLALVNTGGTDASPDTFRIELFDGNTGQKVATLDNQVLNANRWIQINNH